MKHKELYIRIIILKRDAENLKNEISIKLTFYKTSYYQQTENQNHTLKKILFITENRKQPAKAL